MFNIDVSNMYWITEGDDPNDLCAHGDMVATIGDERFEFNGTASATAIYLLKTLTENHLFGEDNQMMPCCGHFYIANDTLDNVIILGCDSGVDWETTHVDNKIKRLLDFTNNPRNIKDPWYTGNFEETFDDVVEGCRAFLDSLEIN